MMLLVAKTKQLITIKKMSCKRCMLAPPGQPDVSAWQCTHDACMCAALMLCVETCNTSAVAGANTLTVKRSIACFAVVGLNNHSRPAPACAAACPTQLLLRPAWTPNCMHIFWVCKLNTSPEICDQENSGAQSSAQGTLSASSAFAAAVGLYLTGVAPRHRTR
jgi:hypothetical protein